MLLGIGIDIVEVKRFDSWEQRELSAIFSVAEQKEADQIESSELRLQFLASRFAAKEAFYKALSNALIHLSFTSKAFSFQFARGQVGVIKGVWDVPTLEVNWGAFEEKIGAKLPKITTHLSISHEKSYACAIVLLEKQK